MILTDYARETLNTPFKHQGRICGKGLDCVGVIQHIVSRAGLPHIDRDGYGKTPMRRELEQVLNNQPCLEITQSLVEGVVCLMKWEKAPMHVAYFTGDTIIHAFATDGKVVEHRIDSEWKKRIVKMYRIKS